MGKGPRNYSEKTIKRLFGLSGNKCAFPGCEIILVNRDNALDSNICHIEAANEGGERYNEKMTDSERADYTNLILLCRHCHDKTNDVLVYTVDILKQMKNDHESYYLHQKLNNNPSMLKNAINAIASIDLDSIEDPKDFKTYDLKEKLSYNGIKDCCVTIDSYKVYQGKINSLYEELENQGSLKKEKLLSVIHQTYNKVKGQFIKDSLGSIDIIRQNSDKIYNIVYDEIYTQMKDSSFFEEDLVLGINIILVDAFIRCKIFEEPVSL